MTARTGQDYEARLQAERQTYKDNTHVHDLPRICFYWLNRYILPELAALGVQSAEHLFLQNLKAVCASSPGRVPRFVSIGSGNCETEIGLARDLHSAGIGEFTIDCLELNEEMLERGRIGAAGAGLENHVIPVCADFNRWQPAKEYDAVIANQALHHVTELEGLFDAIAASLRPRGLLIVSDMIGRNGHRRWPEALPLVESFWNELPEPYRYNQQLRRFETTYPDWDCSLEGFEGIRSQDILPLLLERFHFRFFYAFANVIDPFIDRGFGPNFNTNSDWDRDFIDRVHACDQLEMHAGRIKPTHMLAVAGKEAARGLMCKEGFTPEFCVRRP